MKYIPFILSIVLPVFTYGAAGRAYYLDSTTGNDANNGMTPQTAWKTLQKASGRAYAAGEQLLLRGGRDFKGKLLLHAAGTADQMVVVGAYNAAGGKAVPVIDAKGFLAGIQIVDSSYVEVHDMEITADAGVPEEKPANTSRCGVLITVQPGGDCGHIVLQSLRIHDIFATTATPSEGRNPTACKGMGIETLAGRDTAKVHDVRIENCLIEKTGFTGIQVVRSDDVQIVCNTLRAIGGPGIQPDDCGNLLVRGNLVDGSGSCVDKRMHGRGSGIWPFGCNDVLIEGNAFTHARGKQDSCGAHIDYGNTNVVVQRNLSLDNEGGFIEILGNNHNCAYRYNISINDGARVKGRNGASSNGNTLVVCGYVGTAKPSGPFDTYIYNNTVFTRSDIRSEFQVQSTTQGMLVANNIFYVLGVVQDPSRSGPAKRAHGGAPQDVIFKHNLITRRLPPELYTSSLDERFDNPQFHKPGGLSPDDYVPANRGAVKGTGAVITPVAGDAIGLKIGLEMDTDFFGNKIPAGPPDMGAIVFGGALTRMPTCGARIPGSANDPSARQFSSAPNVTVSNP